MTESTETGLQGKRAAVMASSRGLGFASARALAAGGADVAICARGEKRLAEAAEKIEEETGRRVYRETVDQTDSDAIRDFIDNAAAELGGLDILVNNSGGPRPGLFVELDDDDFYDAFELVFMSNVRATRAALPHLRESNAPAIVNITSVTVKQPLPRLILSNSVRMGLVGLAKTLTDELADDGIRVNNVCPASIHTGRIDQLVRDQADAQGISFDEAEAQRTADIPLGRLGDPSELGHLVAYLASDRASFITGTTVQVDGGIVRGMF